MGSQEVEPRTAGTVATAGMQSLPKDELSESSVDISMATPMIPIIPMDETDDWREYTSMMRMVFYTFAGYQPWAKTVGLYMYKKDLQSFLEIVILPIQLTKFSTLSI